MDATVFRATLLIAGRVGLASLFLLGGLNKILNYEATLTSMAAVGLQPAGLLMPMVISLETVGGALIAFGRKGASLAAVALAIFTIATNVYFHDFWNMDAEIAGLELSLFFKNVSIAGALLFYAASIHSLHSESTRTKPAA
jgi:putative oxidoreductase